MYVKSETGVEFKALNQKERVKYAMARIAKALRERNMPEIYAFPKADEAPSSAYPLCVTGCSNKEELLYLWTAAMVFGRDGALKFNHNAIRCVPFVVFGQSNEASLDPADQMGLIARFSDASLYETKFKKYVTPEMLKILTREEMQAIYAQEKKVKDAKEQVEAKRRAEMKEQEDEIKRQEQGRMYQAGELKIKEAQRQEEEGRRRAEEEQKRLAIENSRALFRTCEELVTSDTYKEYLPRYRLLMVNKYLEVGADIDYVDDKGNTSLICILGGDYRNDVVAELLLKKGANTLRKNNSGLMAIDFVSSSSPLFTLIQEKMKADTLTQETPQLGQMRLNKELHEEIDGIGPKVRKIKALLDSGAQINYQAEKDGYTALMLAVDGQNDRVVEYLLNLGANPLLRNKSGEIASNLASQSSPVYQLLKGHEFLFATSCNDKPTVTALLQADQLPLDFRGPQGYTGLLIAVERGFFELVEYYLSMGAYLFATCDDGKGVFELSTDDEITQLLREYKTQSEMQMQDSQGDDAEPEEPFVSATPVSNFFPSPTGFAKK